MPNQKRFQHQEAMTLVCRNLFKWLIVRTTGLFYIHVFHSAEYSLSAKQIQIVCFPSLFLKVLTVIIMTVFIKILILIIQCLIPLVSGRIKSKFCAVTPIALLNYQKDALKEQPALSVLSHTAPSVTREKCNSIKRGKVKGSLLPGDTGGSWFKLVENKW